MCARRLLLVVGLLVSGFVGVLTPRGAEAAARCFVETGKCVEGIFLDYWETHGGLAQQGLPISAAFDEVSAFDGLTYYVQYFERARFEAHPENRAPYNVLLGQLGREQFQAQYPSGRPAGGTGERCFVETGRCVRGVFLDYWERNGGLAQQGLPLSDDFDEVNPGNGRTYRVQYFERARFEYHPENAFPYDVLLGLVGREQFRGKYPEFVAHEDYFKAQGRVAVNFGAADVTGDGRPDYLYITDGQGCGSCQAKRVVVFTGTKPVFDDGFFLYPEVRILANHRGFQIAEQFTRPGEALCCPTGSRLWTFEWNGSKFVLTGKVER